MFYPFLPAEILPTVFHCHWILNELYTLKLSTTQVYPLNQKKIKNLKKGSSKESRKRPNDHHYPPLSPSQRTQTTSQSSTDTIFWASRHQCHVGPHRLSRDVLLIPCPTRKIPRRGGRWHSGLRDLKIWERNSGRGPQWTDTWAFHFAHVQQQYLQILIFTSPSELLPLLCCLLYDFSLNRHSIKNK